MTEVSVKDLTAKELPLWCGGCGNFNILHALKSVLVELQLPPKDVLIVTGIGCGSKINRFIKTYGFEGLHGRALPVATGAKLANPSLTVIAIAGDGDTYGIGGNHFIHSMRRNLNITLIVQNNSVYGLTKGQYSPTSPRGFRSPSSPFGSVDGPLNPIAVGIAMGATYVARAFSFDSPHLQKLIADGLKHKGFSLIDVLQPCATFNKINSLNWYKERIYKLDSHDPSDQDAAWKKAWEWGDRIPIGLFLKEEKPAYDDSLTPAQQCVARKDISQIDISPILKGFK